MIAGSYYKSQIYCPLVLDSKSDPDVFLLLLVCYAPAATADTYRPHDKWRLFQVLA